MSCVLLPFRGFGNYGQDWWSASMHVFLLQVLYLLTMHGDWRWTWFCCTCLILLIKNATILHLCIDMLCICIYLTITFLSHFVRYCHIISDNKYNCKPLQFNVRMETFQSYVCIKFCSNYYNSKIINKFLLLGVDLAFCYCYIQPIN